MKLKANNLKKSYKDTKVIDDISLEVNSGEIVGLIGPNGSGKTTSFYMMVGIIKPDVGLITLNDEDITTFPLYLRAKKGIGYLPQEVSVFRGLSVEDNIMSVLEFDDELTHKERKKVLEDLLTEFGLKHIRHTLGLKLSGGEKRRAEVARALAMKPNFLFLDEPFAGVDPISVREIQKIISHIKDNHSIGIMITDHNIRETLEICDRTYVLYDGKVIAEGQEADIYNNSKVKQVYLGENFKV